MITVAGRSAATDIYDLAGLCREADATAHLAGANRGEPHKVDFGQPLGGHALMAALEIAGVLVAVTHWRSSCRPTPSLEYGVPDCAAREARLIVGLTGVHRRWLRLDPPSTVDAG